MPLVWTMPDGSVRVTRLLDAILTREQGTGETRAETELRLAPWIQRKTPALAGAVASVVDEAKIARDRSKRYKWRLRNGAVVVDETIPDATTTPLEQRIATLEADVATLKTP